MQKNTLNTINKFIPFIGLFCFVWFAMKIDWYQFLIVFKKTNLLFIFCAELFLVPILLIKSLRWHLLNKKIPVNMSFLSTLRGYSMSLGVGIFTPGRIGEFLKIKYLRDRDKSVSLTRSFASVLLDRLLDLALLLIIAIVTIFRPSHIGTYILIVLFAFVFFTTLVWKCVILKKIKAVLIDVYHYIKNFSLSELLLIIFLTIFSSFIYFSQCYILAFSIGIKLPFIIIAGSVSAAAIFTLLPVSLNGIGTREAALLFLLLPYGVFFEQIILFSLVILFSSIIMSLFALFTSFILKKWITGTN